MNNFLLSCLVCAALFAAPIAAAVIPHPELFERENRRLWPFPDWPRTWGQKQFLRYFRSIDRFFPDRFPLRERLLELARAPCQLLGESPDFEQAFRGKDDFLFAGATLDKLQGMTTPSAEEVLRTRNKFMALNEAFRAIGAEFVIFLGPDKETIYPEALPAIVRPARTRYIQPLIDTVRDAGIRLYDPTERLLRKKGEKLLYYKTDTHWNIHGAFEALKGFSRHMGLPPLPDFEIRSLPGPHREGNLSIMAGFSNYPISREVDIEQIALQWSPPLERPPSAKRAFIFGDSFTMWLLPFFRALFTETTFIFRSAFRDNMSAALESKPDIVIWVNVEDGFADD